MLGGVKRAETKTGTIPATTADTADNVTIGKHPFGFGGFQGLIDDVRIYSRPLTAAEAKQLYQLGHVRVVQ